MTPADIAVITKVMGPVMREFTARAVADAVAPLQAKNAELEQRILELQTRPEPQAGPVGPMGQKGADGTGIASLIVSADGRLLAHLTDGRSLDAGPVPQGPKGDPGDRGEAGRDIDASALASLQADVATLKTDLDRLRSEWPDVDWVVGLVDQKVAAAVAALPAAKDGARGEQGEKGHDGRSIYAGSGPPVDAGRLGDVYLDAITGDVYQCA